MTPIIIGDVNQGLSLAQAIQEVKDRGFHYLDDSRVTFALNNAKNEFEDYSAYPWPWLLKTQTGVAPLSISDLKQVLYVTDTTNNVELDGADSRDVVDLNPNTATAGNPAMWWIDGTGSLRTYPTSTTASLSVRYIRFSPELGASTDVPLIPGRYHPIWIDLAVVELAKDDENWGSVQQLVADTTRRLDQLIEVYETRNRQNPMVQSIVAGSEDW